MTNPRAFSASLLAALCCFSPFPLSAQQPKTVTLKWDTTDLGPFQSGCFKVGDQVTVKGIAIKVGTAERPVTVLFDPELLRVSAAWSGGFLEFPRGRGGLEGTIKPRGKVLFTTKYAPGWSAGEIQDDPREIHQGNLPGNVARYRGVYVSGDKVVLSYTVGTTPMLDLPGSAIKGGVEVITRTLQVGKSAAPMTVLLADLPGGSGASEGAIGFVDAPEAADPLAIKSVAAGLVGAPAGAAVAVAGDRLLLKLPALPSPATFQVAIWAGKKSEMPSNAELIKAGDALPDLASLTKGGAAHWGAPLDTRGKLGTGDGPYLVDEITLPDENPFNSWLRPGGHDFFSNGDAALVNLSGDVWLVSGLDDKLEQVQWKRIATGLFQPLGCKIVDGKIYVLGRDQVTRLHDLNGDGETDYYENFNNDCVVTDNYHEFALDLQTDSAGNFYYAKGSPWEPTNTSPHQGTMLRLSKDGSKLEIIATGLRAPNGLGMGPNNLLTCSDNQGHWVPANRLNIIRPGGFYGMTPAAHKVLRFKATDGTEFDANPSKEAARKEFKTNFWGNAQTPMPIAGYDGPLVWMPQSVDNSPGGEVWVSGGKWGPWEGRMLHMSYGHCLLYGVSMETVDGVTQGAVIKFPFKFPSGVMRGRFHPKDGQLYMSGLNVWQSDASKFGCFTRVRYTGAPVTMPQEVNVLKDGIQLKFTGALDPESAVDPQNFSVERWNYKWTGAYGSADYKLTDGKQGKDLVLVEKITLAPDKKSLTLLLPEMAPCMQMRIKLKIQSAAGQPVESEIHNTIHRVPGQKIAKD